MRHHLLIRAVSAAILLCPIFAAPEAKAEEYYFVMLFGSQSRPKQLRFTHSWAVAVRAIGQGPDLSKYSLEQHTISWLPRTGKVKVWKQRPEPGMNLSNEDTLKFVEMYKEHVTMWGPFICRKEIFDRFIQTEYALNSGAVLYRAIDGRGDPAISDCIHAVVAIDPQFGREHYPLIRIGIPASRFLSRQIMMRSEYEQYKYDNSWIVRRLGLDRRGIEIVPPQRIPRKGCYLCNLPD